MLLSTFIFSIKFPAWFENQILASVEYFGPEEGDQANFKWAFHPKKNQNETMKLNSCVMVYSTSFRCATLSTTSGITLTNKQAVHTKVDQYTK